MTEQRNANGAIDPDVAKSPQQKPSANERKLHILNTSMRSEIKKLREQLRMQQEENVTLRAELEKQRADNDTLRQQQEQSQSLRQNASTDSQKEKRLVEAQRRIAHLASLTQDVHNLRRDAKSLQRYIKQCQMQNTNFILEMQQIVQSIVQQEQVEMEKNYREASGYLIKRGAKVKSWKRRWFLFKPDLTFSYYSSADSSKPINTVDVSSGVFEVYPDNSHKMDFVFKIVTRGRVFFMSASSTEELSRWIHFLRFWRSVNTKKLTENGSKAITPGRAPGTRR